MEFIRYPKNPTTQPKHPTSYSSHPFPIPNKFILHYFHVSSKAKLIVNRSGAYLYRKDRKKRQRLSSSASIGELKPQTRSSTEDNSSCGSLTTASTPQHEEIEDMESG